MALTPRANLYLKWADIIRDTVHAPGCATEDRHTCDCDIYERMGQAFVQHVEAILKGWRTV